MKLPVAVAEREAKIIFDRKMNDVWAFSLAYFNCAVFYIRFHKCRAEADAELARQFQREEENLAKEEDERRRRRREAEDRVRLYLVLHISA